MQHFKFTWSEFILLRLLRLGRMDKKVSLSLDKKRVKEAFQMSWYNAALDNRVHLETFILHHLCNPDVRDAFASERLSWEWGCQLCLKIYLFDIIFVSFWTSRPGKELFKDFKNLDIVLRMLNSGGCEDFWSKYWMRLKLKWDYKKHRKPEAMGDNCKSVCLKISRSETGNCTLNIMWEKSSQTKGIVAFFYHSVELVSETFLPFPPNIPFSIETFVVQNALKRPSPIKIFSLLEWMLNLTSPFFSPLEE